MNKILEMFKSREGIRKAITVIWFVLDVLDGKQDGKFDIFNKKEDTKK